MIRLMQEKIKDNSKYIEYLHTHSYWYKKLNRDIKYWDEFESEVKREYKMYPVDRIEKAISILDTLQTILGTING